MASSPLELYESAYRLHYVENRIPEAVASYKKLIKEFPDANECGYAVIQLQKIKAQSVADSHSDETVRPVASKQSYPLIFISLIVALFSLLSTVYFFKTFSSQVHTEKKRLSTALNALGKMARNEDVEALQLLNDLKNFNGEDIAPYELSADIFRKQHHYSKALNEYETYFKINPDKKPTISVVTLMALYKLKDTKVALAPEPPQKPAPAPDGEPVSPVEKKQPLRKRTKTVKPPPPPNPTSNNSTAKQKKGLLLVDPDSISYF